MAIHEHGHFTITLDLITGMATVTGNSEVANRPGLGVVVQDVGRAVFDSDGNLVFFAGGRNHSELFGGDQPGALRRTLVDRAYAPRPPALSATQRPPKRLVGNFRLVSAARRAAVLIDTQQSYQDISSVLLSRESRRFERGSRPLPDYCNGRFQQPGRSWRPASRRSCSRSIAVVSSVSPPTAAPWESGRHHPGYCM